MLGRACGQPCSMQRRQRRPPRLCLCRSSLAMPALLPPPGRTCPRAGQPQLQVGDGEGCLPGAPQLHCLGGHAAAWSCVCPYPAASQAARSRQNTSAPPPRCSCCTCRLWQPHTSARLARHPRTRQPRRDPRQGAGQAGRQRLTRSAWLCQQAAGGGGRRTQPAQRAAVVQQGVAARK